MHFTNKRGRPKTIKQEKDFGTVEFQRKKLLGFTSEPIDLCLQRKLISHEQHWAAVHFRWLHNLRYGLNGVKSLDPTNIGGRELVFKNSPWYAAREKEYKEALEKLDLLECRKMMIDLVVYNEWPSFLYLMNSSNFRSEDKEALRKLKRSLILLANLWR